MSYDPIILLYGGSLQNMEFHYVYNSLFWETIS